MPNSTDASRNGRPVPAVEVNWIFRVGEEAKAVWGWSIGAPEVRALRSVRRPRSGAGSRHTPRRAYCTTTRDYLHLESGLEHDLLMLVDRPHETAWIVAQPCSLQWQAPVAGSNPHVPDLLTVAHSGAVTVWDVKRGKAAAEPRFRVTRELSARACSEVGWSYEVFTGLPEVHRHNLMWLHSYRNPPSWLHRDREMVLAIADQNGTLLDLLTVGHEVAAVAWHLIWTGELEVDLATRLNAKTTLRRAVS